VEPSLLEDAFSALEPAMSPSTKILCSTALVTLTGLSPLLADRPLNGVAIKKDPYSKFIRIARDMKNQPVALETAITRYRPASGEGELVVDLISVVHVGDRAYYQKLNQHFEQYDVLLYELVAPEGTRIPRGGRRDSTNPLAWVQKALTLVLDLDSQTERIDYTRKNFVHADLSFDQMAEAVKNRGDDAFTLTLSIIADVLRQQNVQAMKKVKNPAWDENLDFLALLTDPAGASKVKRIMAEQLSDLDNIDGLGRTLNTILIDDRNQAAMKVFQRELAKGKKKIGIFYGAAHMPDFEKKLRADFGLRKVSEQWLPAWDLRLRERTVEDLLGGILERLLQ
jgi:hypothetical protein